MPTTTVKCESWCVDHASEDGEICAIEPVLFGPEIDYGPEYGGIGRAGEVFTYRANDEPTRVAVCANGGGAGAALFDVAGLRHIHAAMQMDPEGFASAVATVVKAVSE